MKKALLALGVMACSSTTSPVSPPVDAGMDAEWVPPATCRVPSSVIPDGPWFTEVTAEVGLAKNGDFEPVATGIVAGDIDNDGWIDLIATFFPSQREMRGTKHTRFVFMNRPSPDDPSQRVFVDAYEDSGLMAMRDGTEGRGWSSPSLSDLDNDGDLDAILCPGGADPATQIVDPCDAFLNDGKGKFTLADSSELNATKFWTTGQSNVDFDRDGLLDFYPGTSGLWVNGATITSSIRLYKGNGDGTFTNVAAAAGLPQQRTLPTNFRSNMGVTSCDIDGNGDPDFLTANYGRNPNEVFINQKGHFSGDMGDMLGVAHDDRADINTDWSYRCYCQAIPGDCPPNVPAPPLGYCPGRGWKPGRDDQPWMLGGNNWSISCADIDDDGDMDLMTTETRHEDVGTSDFSELLLNDGPLVKFRRPGNQEMGTYRDHTNDINWNEGDNSAILADIDLDGRKDIYLASSNYPGTHAWIFHQKADGKFEDVTDKAKGWHASTEGPALVDIDNDGDLDVIAGSGTFNYAAATNAIHVYRNDIGQASNYTRIRLTGKGAGFSNRNGIGARVKVTAGGRSQYQELHAANAHTEAGVELTFGLGSACMIDSIEVRWPNAELATTMYSSIRPNNTVELREGDSTPHYVKP
jgi:hypothetical protein